MTRRKMRRLPPPEREQTFQTDLDLRVPYAPPADDEPRVFVSRTVWHELMQISGGQHRDGFVTGVIQGWGRVAITRVADGPPTTRVIYRNVALGDNGC